MSNLPSFVDKPALPGQLLTPQRESVMDTCVQQDDVLDSRLHDVKHRLHKLQLAGYNLCMQCTATDEVYVLIVRNDSVRVVRQTPGTSYSVQKADVSIKTVAKMLWIHKPGLVPHRAFIGTTQFEDARKIEQLMKSNLLASGVTKDTPLTPLIHKPQEQGGSTVYIAGLPACVICLGLNFR